MGISNRFLAACFAALLLCSGCSTQRSGWRKDDADAQSRATPQALQVLGAVLFDIHSRYIRPIDTIALVSRAMDGISSDPAHQSAADMASIRDARMRLARIDREDTLSALTCLGALMEALASNGGKHLEPALVNRAIHGMADGLDRFTHFIDESTYSAKEPQLASLPVIVRQPEAPPVGQSGHGILLGRLAYVHIPLLDRRAAASFRATFGQLKSHAGGSLDGLIVDLRGNEGGLLEQAILIAGMLLPRGSAILDVRGRATADTVHYQATSGDMTGGLPIVVLVDRGTGAGSEVVAGALQDNHRAKLVGSRTAGAGTIQTVYPFVHHGALELTTGLDVLPSHRILGPDGVTPDIGNDEAPAGKDGPAAIAYLANDQGVQLAVRVLRAASLPMNRQAR